ncbi:PcfJ domain-containing protein [Psychrobacillus sp. FSL K6-1464]|uniref:PcfJ domain-containing protein n=1 Tax=Psychrobacillus sp. FSL K6-1464 TaxID=2921545 RepID=UPI0030F916FB
MVIMQREESQLNIFEVVKEKREFELEMELIDLQKVVPGVDYKGYSVHARSTNYYGADGEVYTIHCTCGFIRSNRVYSEWSPSIAKKMTEYRESEDANSYHLQIREARGLMKSIQEVLVEHKKECDNKKLHHGTLKDYVFKEKKATTKYCSYFTLDKFDEEFLRLRRYDLQFSFSGYDVIFETAPKFQVYIGKTGFENLLIGRRYKSEYKFTEVEAAFNTLDEIFEKGISTDKLVISEDVKKHDLWSKTGLGDFSDHLNSVRGFEPSLYGYTMAKKLIKYMHQFHLYPVIERIWKAGLYAYACDAINKHTEIKESIQAELLLPKPIIKHIKTLDAESIKHIRELNKKGGMTEKEAQMVIGQRLNSQTLNKMVELTEMGNYTCRELFQYADRAWHSQAIETGRVVLMLRDYVNMNIMMNAEYEKFPKSLIREHDVTARDFKFVKDDLLNEQYEKSRFPEVENQFSYENKEFLIRAPKNLEEIAIEGSALSHCVASYADRVAQGTTTILLVRKKGEVEKPWVTIEVSSSNTIVQARGKHNAHYTVVGGAPLKSFIEEWKKLKKVS